MHAKIKSFLRILRVNFSLPYQVVHNLKDSNAPKLIHRNSHAVGEENCALVKDIKIFLPTCTLRCCDQS